MNSAISINLLSLRWYLTIIILLTINTTYGQSVTTDNLWNITTRQCIVLYPDSLQQKPHADNIEMSGRKVAAIIYYEIDSSNNLSIERDVIFPQLRTYNKSNEPDWKKYRAYYRKRIKNNIAPVITHNEKTLVFTQIDSIEIGGMITFYYRPLMGLQLTKQIYPSMKDRYMVEEWKLTSTTTEALKFHISNVDLRHAELGYKGKYSFVAYSQSDNVIELEPNATYTFPVYYGALLNDESRQEFDFHHARESRELFLTTCRDNLILETPDPILNTLFYFSKIRAAESIYDSSMGVVHSPGGGNYYVGIWANDQIEYSGPFFPYLGYNLAVEAAYNAYATFLQNIPNDDRHIPYAFEVDGHFPMTHLDRGDAAMTAYGTAQYLLNHGDISETKKLWPLIEWCLEYCHQHRNASGAVMSESDEMEGRIETGDANLATSSLYYGGLKYSEPIARALGMSKKADIYHKRYSQMEKVIENYFGATLEGLETYRYFEENKYLRHWICLPLTMGITKRKDGTLQALFEKLWTDNGILVQYNPDNITDNQTFWDRATLYALRGAIKTTTDHVPIDRLRQYSSNRLLGDHVPYAVEAYPENNMKHLSAESALYCRVFIEGLLGIEPANFIEFTLTPKLPEGWDSLELQRIFLWGIPHDIKLNKIGNKIRLQIQMQGELVLDQVVDQNQTVHYSN